MSSDNLCEDLRKSCSETMIVSIKDLKEKGACENQVEKFEKFLEEKDKEDEIEVTVETVKEAKDYGLDIEWAIQKGFISKEIACSSANLAYEYARYVDKRPTEETREAVLSSPCFAYYYARYVDGGSTKEIREAVLSSPKYAYRYAKYVDEGPTEKTKEAVLSSPFYAYKYAKEVDEEQTKETREAVKGSRYEKLIRTM